MSKSNNHILQCLEHAVIECSDRGLSKAARWAAEKLNYVRDQLDSPRLAHSTSTIDVGPFMVPTESHFWHSPSDRLLYLEAKSYFNCHEYLRCAHTLRNSVDSKAIFLWGYSLYLAGESLATEIRGDPISNPSRYAIKNTRISEISNRLQSSPVSEKVNADPWLQYLLSLIYLRKDDKMYAQKCLILSARLYPYNWSVWSELAKLVASKAKFQSIRKSLPKCFMFDFFVVEMNAVEESDNQEAAMALNELSSIFMDRSPVLLDAQAHISYAQKDYELAVMHWNSLYIQVPYRMDSFPEFSLALMHFGNPEQLGLLVNHALSVDKGRPEPWFSLSIQYTINNDYHGAVNCLHRCIKLNPDDVPAWVTMAASLACLNQNESAISAFNNALCTLSPYPRWFKALFGLGEIHFSLDSFVVALEYFGCAKAVRDEEPRVWAFLALCLDHLGKPNSAKVAAKRSIQAAKAQKDGEPDPNMYALVGRVLATEFEADEKPPIKLQPRAKWAQQSMAANQSKDQPRNKDDDPLVWYLCAWNQHKAGIGEASELSARPAMDTAEFFIKRHLNCPASLNDDEAQIPNLHECLDLAATAVQKDVSLKSRHSVLEAMVCT